MANPVLLGANNAPQAKSMMTALTGLVEDGGRVGQIHSDRKVFTPITVTANVQQSSAYNGYFKVVETTDESGKTMLKIIDGAKPYSNVAGVSDLGSVGQLTIEKKNSSYLYIYPEWIKDSNPPRYTFKLSTRGNSSIDIEFLLATIDKNGIITQRWTDGTIYWGSRFFV